MRLDVLLDVVLEHPQAPEGRSAARTWTQARAPSRPHQNDHVHAGDGVTAHLHRLDVPGGEVLHVRHRVPARSTASCAASMNDRPTGKRHSSEVCDSNTRRGGGSPDMTRSIPAP